MQSSPIKMQTSTLILLSVAVLALLAWLIASGHLFWVFVVGVAGFVLVGLLAPLGKKGQPFETSEDFFTTRRTGWLWISLAAANLTVAGGLFALTAGSDAFGYYILVLPVTTCLGIWIFYKFFQRNLQLDADGVASFNIQSVNSILSKDLSNASPFARIFSTSLAFVYVFTLGWEFWVVSQAISFLLSGATSDVSETQSMFSLVAFILAVAVAAYVFRGGFERVVITDFVQAVLIAVMIIGLVATHTGMLQSAELIFIPSFTIIQNHTPPFSIPLLFFFVTVFILNVVAQLQSPMNWIIARSASRGERSGMTFLWGGGAILIAWMAIIYIAFLTATPTTGDSTAWLRILDDQFVWLRGVLLIGVTALTLSTADSIVVGIMGILHQAWAKQQSDPPSPSLRAAPTIFLAVALVITFGLMESQPRIFQSLIAIGSSLSVYAGVLLLVAFKREYLASSTFYPYILGFLFIVVALMQVILQLTNPTNLVSYNFVVVGVACLLGVIFASKLGDKLIARVLGQSAG